MSSKKNNNFTALDKKGAKLSKNGQPAAKFTNFIQSNPAKSILKNQKNLGIQKTK